MPLLCPCTCLLGHEHCGGPSHVRSSCHAWTCEQLRAWRVIARCTATPLSLPSPLLSRSWCMAIASMLAGVALTREAAALTSAFGCVSNACGFDEAMYFQ